MKSPCGRSASAASRHLAAMRDFLMWARLDAPESTRNCSASAGIRWQNGFPSSVGARQKMTRRSTSFQDLQ